ncbi:MAG: hypothetical protein ACM3S0_00190 [Acidobacteriota bacterium]
MSNKIQVIYVVGHTKATMMSDSIFLAVRFGGKDSQWQIISSASSGLDPDECSGAEAEGLGIE